MKVIRYFVGLLAVTTIFACTDKADNNPVIDKPTPLDAGGSYKDQTATVNRDGDKTGTVTLRYYDSNKGVAYISASEFHRLMMPKESMKVTRQGDMYEIATKGGTAMVDVKADRFTTNSIISIFDMISTIGSDIPSAVSYDGSPYLKPKERLLLPETAAVTFDFKKYNIDLRDDGSNVYFPYATLADIYSDMNMHITYVNETDNEVVVSSSLDYYGFKAIDPKHDDRVYGRTEVTDDMAKYRYHELCFVFDYIYGYPGRKNDLFVAGMEQCGLDAALDKIKEGAHVKTLLKSKDNAAFILGMDGLQQLADDGGHTMVTQITNVTQADVKDRYQTYATQYPGVAGLMDSFTTSYIAMDTYKNGISETRQKTYGDKKYIVSADKSTAVIVLDSFMDLDLEGWKDYYASLKTEADWEMLLAREGNALATVLSCLRQARKDGVKNVIFDVTLNTGGSSDIALAILSLITKNEAERQQVKLYSDYVISKQASTTNYLMDRNFDGKFDAEDAKVDNSDLNFAVLTSHRSFSCANFFPSLMKDSGFKVMGERSGGGSCAIQLQFTPDGMMYVISCYRLRMLNAKRENIDVGIPVDIAVPAEKFYDIENLAKEIKK